MDFPRPITSLLERSAQRWPERIALSDADTQLTYADLAARVAAFAANLASNGLVAGERVAIVLESSWQYAVTLYGVLRAGGIAVPLNAAAKAGDLAGWIRHSGATRVVADRSSREFAPLLAELGGQVTWIEPCFPAGEGAGLPEPACLQPACILYTSGTTGTPKGVLLSHGNLASNALAIAGYLQLDETSSILTVLPFYYAYGSSILHSHLATGGRVVIERGFTFPHVTLQALALQRITGFAGVPSTYALLLARVKVADFDFSALRYLTQAGGAMSPSLTQQVREAFPAQRLFVMYGQTEATSRISYLPPERLDDKLGSVGVPIDGVQWQVRGEDGGVCDFDTPGTLWVKGPNVMLGYWQNPDATRAVICDGWLCTGDVGRIDTDGYLYLHGRRSDIIKVGAHRVHPQDVEDAISEIEGVEDVAVVGVEDEILGEVIKAYVIARPAATLGEQQVRRHCLQRLAGYKVPKQVEFVKDLPRTASGKLRRQALTNRDKV